MQHFGLYQKLIALPLFVGMGKDEMEQIITLTKFDFRKAMAGENIVTEGEKSGRLMFLVDGEMEISTHAHDNGYTVCEYFQAPYIVQPERVFGLSQRYSSTITALTTCNLVCVDKNTTLKLASDSLIFRLNLLNMMSTALQKKMYQGWSAPPQDLSRRLVRFFLNHCMHPAGKKIFKIKMTRLAAEINDSRLHVSQVLNAMEARGTMILGRGKIEIPHIEQLAGSL